MHRYVIFSQNAPSSQPAMRALAGWPIACIHPASQPRACIMHEDSGCTQIRSWMAGWMDGWLDACARARAHASSQPAARAHPLCMQSLDALRSDHALYACRTSGVPDHWSLHACCMGRKDTIAAQPAQPAAERLEDAALLSYDPAPGGMRCRQQLGY